MKRLLLIFVFINSACGQGDLVTTSNYPIPGPQGPPGTQVTMVQFCTNYNTNYPSTFPEYGFCVNGNLYATYWDGTDAWTSEVVPGNYESTSTSAPCNFSVSQNCAITDY